MKTGLPLSNRPLPAHLGEQGKELSTHFLSPHLPAHYPNWRKEASVHGAKGMTGGCQNTRGERRDSTKDTIESTGIFSTYGYTVLYYLKDFPMRNSRKCSRFLLLLPYAPHAPVPPHPLGVEGKANEPLSPPLRNHHVPTTYIVP